VIQGKNGFTILELVCALMIIAVLSAVMVPAVGRMMRSAEMARERVQARSLWAAVQIYLMEEHKQEELRSYILMEELGEELPDSMENPLHRYLQGKISGKAMIQSLTVSKDYSEITELDYQTDQWIVTVTRDSIDIQPLNEF
jgi:prepilin-type N-terminal cleavage/methylation domain-containing protein